MSLKKGDTGAAVADLQRRLTKTGYPVEPDGWFGDATEQALLAFQRDYMITAIGQAGPRTMAALLGSERGNQLTISHMQEGADLLGLPLATMATVAQVESIGEGFTTDMRPVVLFERHVLQAAHPAPGQGHCRPDGRPLPQPGQPQARRLCGRGGRVGAAATRHQLAPGCRHRVGQLGHVPNHGLPLAAAGFYLGV